jgi:hypothetical protein
VYLIARVFLFLEILGKMGDITSGSVDLFFYPLFPGRVGFFSLLPFYRVALVSSHFLTLQPKTLHVAINRSRQSRVIVHIPHLRSQHLVHCRHHLICCCVTLNFWNPWTDSKWHALVTQFHCLISIFQLM